MTASRCAAARSTRASHSSVLHSSRLMRETWSCTLISLLLSRGSYGGDTEKYHAVSTRADPTFAEAWYNLSDLLGEQGRSEAAIDVCGARSGLHRTTPT